MRGYDAGERQDGRDETRLHSVDLLSRVLQYQATLCTMIFIQYIVCFLLRSHHRLKEYGETGRGDKV